MRNTRRKNLGHYLALALIGIAVIAYLMPIYWIVATSLKAPGDIVTKAPKFLFRLTLDNYRRLMPAVVPGIIYVFLTEALVGGFALRAVGATADDISNLRHRETRPTLNERS